MYALSPVGSRIAPSPGQSGVCPCCKAPVIPKCGEINIWHWAHASADCDPWSEPETDWHYNWKLQFPDEWREVTVGDHRADICTPNGVVVEFQKSSISPAEIAERELEYERMAWVFDAREAYANDRLDIRHKGDFVTFRWKHARKTIAHAKKPVFLHISGDDPGTLLKVRKIHQGDVFAGWGQVLDGSELVYKITAHGMGAAV